MQLISQSFFFFFFFFSFAPHHHNSSSFNYCSCIRPKSHISWDHISSVNCFLVSFFTNEHCTLKISGSVGQFVAVLMAFFFCLPSRFLRFCFVQNDFYFHSQQKWAVNHGGYFS